MSAVADLPVLAPEWERLGLLGHCLAEERRGGQVADEVVARLRRANEQVQAARPASWGSLGRELDGAAFDLLACAVGPEAEPRLGWMFQQLQPGRPEPYPSPALVHELFALEGLEAERLYHALQPQAPLQRLGLVQWEEGDIYRPLRPAPGVSARLLGRGGVHADPPPPGATPVRLTARREELILPPNQGAILEEFLHWIRYRRQVVEEWGGSAAGGPVALFAGPSGTGKTFAAAVLAGELGWPLYRVDLGTLVSKYIGETEKNLNRLFDAAHGREMMLQFDEADALFSKRGEVREARDRYSNMEVSHLLARIESHQGPVILTTNLRGHLDPAFARRFQVVVDFPRPDAAGRALLWQRLLPPRAPREPEVEGRFLGAAVTLSGGQIRNAALHAAFLAAHAGSPIGLPQVAVAVWRELGKDGRQVQRGDLGPLADHLPEGIDAEH